MLSELSLQQIKDPLHVRYVLGVKTPLNESLENPILLKEIVEKQLIFESFMDSLKKYLGNSFNKIVSVIKSPFDIAVLIKNLVTNPKLLESVLNTYKNKIKTEVDKFKKILLSVSEVIKKIVEAIKKIPANVFQKFGLAVEKIITFYESIVAKITKYFKATIDFVENKIGDGWLGLLKIIVVTGILLYGSDKLASYVKTLTKPLELVTKPLEFVKSINDGEAKKKVDELSDGLDSVIKDSFNDTDKNLEETVDSIKNFFGDILKGKNWLWKYVVEYLSKIAEFIKGKIKTTDKGNIDLTHYGRLERDMKKIQDNHLKHLVNKIIIEMNNSNIDNIYNKKTYMSNLNKIIKKDIQTLLETKGFEDMEVAFGVKHKSDNLSDEEKTQFGPMGQIQKSEGGSFVNPKVPGTKEVEKANTQGGKDAQAYYKEVAKKVKDFQTPDNGEKIEGPRVPTNTEDEDGRIKTTGYDVGVSGMEAVSDMAEKEGGSEETKKKYKERMEKLNGNDATYQKMKKNADKTNTLKYDKDARNGRPNKVQTSKQPENPSKKNESFEKYGFVFEDNKKMSADVQKIFSYIQKFVLTKYPQLKEKIDLPTEKAQIIALFAKEFGIDASQLGRVKSIIDKSEKESQEQTDNMTESNTFKVKGKIVSESQVLKLTEKLPNRVKIDETRFSITDGENTYKLIWEGDSENGEAVITNFKNSGLVNEDIQKMKYLWGFKPKEEKKIVKEEAEETFKKMFRQIKK